MNTPWHLLYDSCTIERTTVTYGSSGSPQKGWANHLVGIRCRVQVGSGWGAPESGRPQSKYTYRVYVAGNQDITEQDRVSWGTKTLYVHQACDWDGLGVLMMLGCEEAKPE